MATARQMSPLKNIIPSPAAIESHYSIRVQLPRRQHGHTRRINDFVTYEFESMYLSKKLLLQELNVMIICRSYKLQVNFVKPLIHCPKVN